MPRSDNAPSPRMQQKFQSFLLVGGLATLLHYLLLIALVQLAALPPLAASTTGFTLSAALNYSLNRRYTFRSSRAHRQALPRFAITALLGLALNAAFIWVGHDLLGLHYLLAQMIATLLTLAFNFFLNLLWTFVDLPEPKLNEPPK